MPEETWRDAEPAHRRSRPAASQNRSTRSDVQARPRSVQNDRDFDRPMGLGEIEAKIRRCEDELLEFTTQHMRLGPEAASAKADWLAHLSRVLTRISNSGEKGAADIREATARVEIDPITGREGNDLYRTYKILDETVDTQARAMRAIEARLSAWQTLAANVRQQT